MRKAVVALTLALAFCLVSVGTAALQGKLAPKGAPAATAAPTTTAPQEDSPAWDCATMGNLTCGAGAVPLSTYCQDEPSATVEGVERIAYPAGATVTVAGIAAPCQ